MPTRRRRRCVGWSASRRAFASESLRRIRFADAARLQSDLELVARQGSRMTCLKWQISGRLRRTAPVHACAFRDSLFIDTGNASVVCDAILVQRFTLAEKNRR